MKNKKTKKKIGVFFSYGISLKQWKINGSIERELKIYKYLYDKGYEIYLITYGNIQDIKIAQKYRFINVLPLFNYTYRPNNKYYRFLKSFFLPIILKSNLKKIDLYKTNQITGSIPAFISKLLYSKPLIIRCGYEPIKQILFEKKYSYIQIFFLYIIFKLIYKFSNLINVSSKEIKNFINTYYNVNKKKIFQNWNYVDIHKFKKINKYKKNNRILFIGRLIPIKNIYILFEALANTGIGLDIVGEGYLKNKLIEYSKKNKLDVNFLGVKDHYDLPNLINRYSIYVICSKFEGNPKTLLEVMSCEIPVIGTKVSGISEIIRNNFDGLLVKPNSKALNKAIINLIKDKKKQNYLAKNARKKIINNCSLENYITYEINLFNKLKK